MKNALKTARSMGGNTKREGYIYLAASAEHVITIGEFPLKRLGKEVYAPVAARYKIKPTRVAREIARAVEEIWDHGDRERLEEILNRKCFEKPSPGEMILGLSMYIVKEDGEG